MTRSEEVLTKIIGHLEGRMECHKVMVERPIVRKSAEARMFETATTLKYANQLLKDEQKRSTSKKFIHALNYGAQATYSQILTKVFTTLLTREEELKCRIKSLENRFHTPRIHLQITRGRLAELQKVIEYLENDRDK